MTKKFSLLILVSLLLSFASGCTAQYGEKSFTNVAGIYQRETHSYTAVSETTIPLRRLDVDPGAPLSGHKTTLLWGLFTYYDY